MVLSPFFSCETFYSPFPLAFLGSLSFIFFMEAFYVLTRELGFFFFLFFLYWSVRFYDGGMYPTAGTVEMDGHDVPDAISLPCFSSWKSSEHEFLSFLPPYYSGEDAPHTRRDGRDFSSRGDTPFGWIWKGNDCSSRGRRFLFSNEEERSGFFLFGGRV